ncbi:uncharacterized protein LOC114174465 [Vigna unguiculata]|uniref:uncharacterized protein LOC114174465 n=1 Tax=Vigna unguiculata TaxID=3917 RepID=UPI00101679A2|nr:uncharacterized protein LOC114174465 [Vigna unguiculata]
MFREARNAGQRPYWLGDDVWNNLLAYWNSPTYYNKCVTAQRNRGSEKGGSLHTTGSMTTHEHAIRMAKELGRAAHIDEVFQQTHMCKGTDQFVDERSRRTYVRSEQGSCAGGSQDIIDDLTADDTIRTKCWVEVVGGKNKGRIYGTGQLAGGSSGMKPQSTASTSSAEEVTFLKQRLQENDEKLKATDQQLQENDQAYAKLKGQFQSLQNILLTLLPPDQEVLRQAVSNLAQSQQLLTTYNNPTKH